MSEDIFEEEEQIAQEQTAVETRVLRRTIRDLPTLQSARCKAGGEHGLGDCLIA